MKRAGSRKLWFTLLYAAVMAVMAYVLVYMPTPYLIYRPGSAEEVKPMVSVKDGDPTEQGTFMMTTVSASYANWLMLGLVKGDRNAEVRTKESRLQGSSEDEYAAKQVYYMDNSQSSAIEAAYKKAGVAYRIVPQYIYVLETGAGADPFFHPGDKIVEVDGESVEESDDLQHILKGKQPGDSVAVKLDRKGEGVSGMVKLTTVKDTASGEQRTGFGVGIATLRTIVPESAGHEITFSSTDVGGPSAGLMFTLEIYNQLTPGDLSKGYRIAGTGTINKEGTVGAIGGVGHKIVAADREHAEIFFVPEENAGAAEAKAKQIGTGMKLVSVRTLDDALHYLDALPVKEQ
ncbi:PDZ domain-containing protein [Paenibacillus sp. P96]|uniref:endopeptidase La n=1 Tax=Paenibacillus zeirhizosphaerae TaxID=2987519 RepID=A0ABT9FSB8_9BACL|nr:PDZ domain-containing protein [Paenibacillus sp. P96]MDP4097588.1 PDZ domain-containing protein [Paenibacillus sp. P96]